MARKASPKKTRPSGIEQSANGNYYYWKCNVTGKETFAPEDRFKEIVSKYGSEEKLYKTYVLRSVQKYLDSGFDATTIKSIMDANDGDLPSLKKDQAVEASKPEPIQPVEQKPLNLPWTGNPDYFRSPPLPFNAAEETKNACIYPNRNLSDKCYGCNVYDVCQSSVKYSMDEIKKSKHSIKPKEITS